MDSIHCVRPGTLPGAACRLTPSCGRPLRLRRLPEWLTGPTQPPQPRHLPVHRHHQRRQPQRCRRLRQSSRPCHIPAALSTSLLQLSSALLSSRLSAWQPPQLWAVHQSRLQAGNAFLRYGRTQAVTAAQPLDLAQQLLQRKSRHLSQKRRGSSKGRSSPTVHL